MVPGRKQRLVRVLAALGALALYAPCLAKSFDAPRMTFRTVSDATISPPGTRSARPDTILIDGRFYVCYLQLAPARMFRLLVLDKNLQVLGTAGLFSGSNQATDMRVCKGPSSTFFCAFETTEFREGVPNHLNLARYQAKGTLAALMDTKPQVDEAMPVVIPDGLPRRGDDLVDDPTPFFYKDRFYVVTRKWESARLKVRVFSADLHHLETHELDLGGAFPGLFLSVPSLVEIEGRPYLVAGVFNDPPMNDRAFSHIVAVGLDETLSTGGRPRILSGTKEYEGYVACARWSEGILFVGYDVLTGVPPSGHKGMIKAFDVRNGFQEAGAVQVNAGRMVDNHFTFEVVGQHLCVFYETPDQEVHARVISVAAGKPSSTAADARSRR